jgi:hypothetical protein
VEFEGKYREVGNRLLLAILCQDPMQEVYTIYLEVNKEAEMVERIIQ